MTLIYLCSGLGVFAAVCAYAFGPKSGAGVVLVVIVLVGVVLSVAAPAMFQAYLMFVGYGAGLVLLASGVGLAAGAQLKRKQYWLTALILLTVPYLIWSTHANEARQAEEKALAYEFVTNNKQVAALAGGPFKVFPASSTTYKGDNTPSRYEFSIAGSNPFFVIVNVSQQAGGPKFGIGCATKLSGGQREAFKEDCLQAPLPLPK